MGRNNKVRSLPKRYTNVKQEQWKDHYFQYLCSLAYQIFEWKGLPESVDPRYLEMSLHMFGFVGFYNDPKLSYIAVQGAVSGQIDHYNLPTFFQASAPSYQKKFPLSNYKDVQIPNSGIVIWNNDYHVPSIPSLKLFAEDLAHVKMVTQINVNAQKTPILLSANDNTKFSIQNIYDQYEGNAPVIITHESADPDTIKVHKTDAAFVADKLNAYRNTVWAEAMTYLGIKNANTDKKERLITDEVQSNDDQIESSTNIYLKSRQEACALINSLYPELNVSVKIRGEEETEDNEDEEVN